ncbi:hypothetical protein IKQ26_08195 [bacterium]|nr:hypothetical protein [bacterium]
MTEINPAFLQQQGSIQAAGQQPKTEKPDNPYNLVMVETAKEVGEIAKSKIGSMPYRIATAGYSAPPENYEGPTKQFLKNLDLELGTRSTAFVTSPTADAGSIDAITTEVTGLNKDKLFYTTSQDYVGYINPSNFPPTIDTVAYSMLPKHVLPNNAEYSKATAEASNIFLATGGRNTTVSDFVNAIKHGNKAIILNNPAIETPAWGEPKNRVENASKYLTSQINAFRNGQELPYPEVEGFTKEFMSEHKSELNNLVKTITIQDNNPNAIYAAAKEAANFIR